MSNESNSVVAGSTPPPHKRKTKRECGLVAILALLNEMGGGGWGLETMPTKEPRAWVFLQVTIYRFWLRQSWIYLLYGTCTRDPNPNPDPAMNRRNPDVIPTCMDAKA